MSARILPRHWHPGVAALVMMVGGLCGGCALNPEGGGDAASGGGSARAADSAPAVEAEGEAKPEAGHEPDPDVPFHEQVDYGRLPQGFNRFDEDFQVVNLCTDDMVEHYEKLGYKIRMYLPLQMHSVRQTSWSCSHFDLSGRLGEETEILAEGYSREDITTVLPQNLFGDAEDTWLPGAYYLDYDALGEQEDNCQIAIDSPRGRIAVTHYGGVREGRVQEHCQLARQTLEKLYQDEVFLRKIYGDDIPLKNEPRG
ncbi:hypothetical protein C1Y63_01100 [Corynebacterium sp. 13CS0277]|uniref:hypothetical protein n=1 Tax=Corynebacterium sp. 13CS0277 TaxID=2071994 RepID=UPI000D03F372|nr:hypothetical protein [Corynebacterium sp. 13CS0277]PRQ12418.1 hypothetical protein C1Y63_01100 [Corynebacterium sp. 13CS0277]